MAIILKHLIRKYSNVICLGGADPNNDLLKLLSKIENLNIDNTLQIVIGSAYQHITILKNQLNNSALKYKLHQNLNADQMADLMRFSKKDQAFVSRLIEKQKEIFDGRTSVRFFNIFRDLGHELNSSFRVITKYDLSLIYVWANDEMTRMQSYNQAGISLEEHSQWFLTKINNPNSCFYILENRGKA